MNGSNGSHTAPEGRPYLFVASAQSSAALRDLVSAYRSMLARPAPGLRLRDLCYHAGIRDGHDRERLAVVARSLEDLTAQLDRSAAVDASPTGVRQTPAPVRGKLAFVFSGQGPQWLGMGCRLFEHEPVFRAALERCDEEVRALLSWSVIEQLFATPAASRLDDIDVVQPVIFAFQVALAALWRSWGITPDFVVGHSVGELAAAHVAGVLSLPDAARIVCARSRVSLHPCTLGAMAVIGLPAGEVEAVIRPSSDRVWVAIHESPESTVISGDPQAVDRIVAEVLARDVFGRRVKAPVAGHSPQWDRLRKPLLDLIATIRPQAARVRLQSATVLELDAQAGDGAAMGPSYWWRNLREPVLFAQATRNLMAQGVDTFLEISPHPILCHVISQCAQHANVPIAALASTRRGEDERSLLLSSLAALQAQGRAVDWKAVCDGTAAPVTLPELPRHGESSRFTPTRADDAARAAVPRKHPMLGRHLELQGAGGHHVWERSLDGRTVPMLADHRVAGNAVVPSGAYLELALAATRKIQQIGEPGDPQGTGAGGGPQSMAAELLAAEPGQREHRLEALLTQHLVRILGRPAAQIQPDMGLHHLGLDSLMALEFRNRIRADLDVAPPLARLVVSDVSLRTVSRDLLDQLATKAQAPPQIAQDAGATPQATALDIDELTDDQIRALLREIDGDG